MARKCSIKDCKAEFQNEKKNRQVFKFPSDEEMKNKWLRSIGHNLKEGRSHRKNLYVCDIHFEGSCFYNNDLKIMKDGREVILPRKLLKLKKDSIPSIFKDDSQDLKGTLTPSDNGVADFHSLASSFGKSIVIKKEEACSSTSAESLSTGKIKRHEQIDLSPTSRRRVVNVNQVMSLPYSDTVNESIVVPPSKCILNEKYTKADLIKDWNERDAAQFPIYWGMLNNTNGVFFIYIGDVEGVVTRSIFVNNDMTAEIRAHNHVAKFPPLQKIFSLEDVRQAMIKLVCLNVCERAWKGQCKNGFFIPKRFSISKKCTDCQVIAKREKDREQRTAKRLIMKCKRQMNNMKKVKERLNRAIKKIEIMQENIENLMSKCSLINEESLNNKIKDLPKQQKEVIKTILKYGKMDDKRGMRYTHKWMLECILLSIKSRKAYLHVRNHNILPLPTFTTLRKYLKNMNPRYPTGLCTLPLIYTSMVFTTLKKKESSDEVRK